MTQARATENMLIDGNVMLCLQYDPVWVALIQPWSESQDLINEAWRGMYGCVLPYEVRHALRTGNGRLAKACEIITAND